MGDVWGRFDGFAVGMKLVFSEMVSSLLLACLFLVLLKLSPISVFFHANLLIMLWKFLLREIC